MAVNVETLDKLERRITLTLAADAIHVEVESRLKKLSRTVKADGFRPGKVPMSVVAQRYGYSVHYEVMNDKVGQAFSQAANEAKLRVAGAPTHHRERRRPEGEIAFDATFEVYPGGQDRRPVERRSRARSTTEVTRRGHRQDARHPAQAAPHLRAAPGGRRRRSRRRPRDDRLRRQDRRRAVRGRQGRGLPVHDRRRPDARAIRRRRARHEGRRIEDLSRCSSRPTITARTWPAKEADFIVTVKKIEAQHLPEVNEAFAKSLGHRRRARSRRCARDVKKNLEREVKFRVLARNKAARDGRAGRQAAELDVPKALVAGEVERMIEGARADLKKRGVKDADNGADPRPRSSSPQAEKRVRLGLVVGRAGARQQPAGQARAAAGAHRGDGAELREAVGGGALVPRRPPAHGRGRGRGDREQRRRLRARARRKVTDKALPFDELMTA